MEKNNVLTEMTFPKSSYLYSFTLCIYILYTAQNCLKKTRFFSQEKL